MLGTSCDNAPAFYTFTDQIDLSSSTQYSSNIVQITGMDTDCDTAVSVSGDGSPEYRICSTSNCSAVDTDWTGTGGNAAMQGKYFQLRATTSASANTTHMVTASIGGIDSEWDITTTANDCGTEVIGTVCADGSVYAGLTPDGNVPMYVTRCDFNMTWDGATCADTRVGISWNNGQSDFVDTPIANCATAASCVNTGEANTATLVATDSDSNDAGSQYHGAARYCDTLVAHGKSDWYLPSAPELNVLYTNNAAIGNFRTTASSWYWSSSESPNAWYQNFTDGSQWAGNKSSLFFVRCARK